MINEFNMKSTILITTLALHCFGNIAMAFQETNGTCYSNSSEAYLYNNRCCKHFEFVMNKCEACKVGYYTKGGGGEKCIPCSKNKYGRKCAFPCKCKAHERCDNTNGTCIPGTTTLEIVGETWTNPRYEKQSTEKNEISIGVTKHKATTNYAILIYMICAGFIILVLCAVAACYKYQKNVQKVQKGTIKHGERGSAVSPIPLRSMQPNDFIEQLDNESVYELIDDENLLSL